MVERYPNAARVGRRIQVLRGNQGLSVRGLARKVPMSHANLSRIERGEFNIPIETLVRIAHALGVSLGELCAEIDIVQLLLAMVREQQDLGQRLDDLVQRVLSSQGEGDTGTFLPEKYLPRYSPFPSSRVFNNALLLAMAGA